MKVVRLSIVGNECVHCGTVITQELKCKGCGWVDPMTRSPKLAETHEALKDYLIEEK